MQRLLALVFAFCWSQSLFAAQAADGFMSAKQFEKQISLIEDPKVAAAKDNLSVCVVDFSMDEANKKLCIYEFQDWRVSFNQLRDSQDYAPPVAQIQQETESMLTTLFGKKAAYAYFQTHPERDVRKVDNQTTFLDFCIVDADAFPSRAVTIPPYLARYRNTRVATLVLRRKVVQRVYLYAQGLGDYLPTFKVYKASPDPVDDDGYPRPPRTYSKVAEAICNDKVFKDKDIVLKTSNGVEGKGNIFLGKDMMKTDKQQQINKFLQEKLEYPSDLFLAEEQTNFSKLQDQKDFVSVYRAISFATDDGLSHSFIHTEYLSPTINSHHEQTISKIYVTRPQAFDEEHSTKEGIVWENKEGEINEKIDLPSHYPFLYKALHDTHRAIYEVDYVALQQQLQGQKLDEIFGDDAKETLLADLELGLGRLKYNRNNDSCSGHFKLKNSDDVSPLDPCLATIEPYNINLSQEEQKIGENEKEQDQEWAEQSPEAGTIFDGQGTPYGFFSDLKEGVVSKDSNVDALLANMAQQEKNQGNDGSGAERAVPAHSNTGAFPLRELIVVVTIVGLGALVYIKRFKKRLRPGGLGSWQKKNKRSIVH